MNETRLSLRLARRELRSGLSGFWVFFACIALGVATVAGVGSLAAAIHAGLKAEGRVLLGGEVDLRLTHQEVNAEQRRWLVQNTRAISEVAEMRVMAGRLAGRQRRLVELKAVDGRYPLFGGLVLGEGGALGPVLARRGDAWGAAVDQRMLDYLGLQRGDRFRIGDAVFVAADVIAREPDRGTRAFRLGPRVLTSHQALAATGLVLPGSLIRYHYRLALPRGRNLATWRARLDTRFPGAGWRVRDLENAAPGIQRFVDRVALFLSLIGLTALLVGGVGVANAVRAFLEERLSAIATLKCLGASRRLVFRIYLIQVMAIGMIGVAAGLLAGAAAPLAAAPLLDGRLPVAGAFTLYAGPLLRAAAFGLLTAAGGAFPGGRSLTRPAAGRGRCRRYRGDHRFGGRPRDLDRRGT